MSVISKNKIFVTMENGKIELITIFTGLMVGKRLFGAIRHG